MFVSNAREKALDVHRYKHSCTKVNHDVIQEGPPLHASAVVLGEEERSEEIPLHPLLNNFQQARWVVNDPLFGWFEFFLEGTHPSFLGKGFVASSGVRRDVANLVPWKTQESF
jgi:hypothetical protein